MYQSLEAAVKLPSVNREAAPLLAQLLREEQSLRLGSRRLENGVLLIDAGIEQIGGLEAGRRIAEICMGGLGSVRLCADSQLRRWPWRVEVYSRHPVLACLGSQYAGWSLSWGQGKNAFQALGSGPARALGSKEALFQLLDYRDQAEQGCLVIETDRFPAPELAQQIAENCALAPERLCLILVPTRSLSGAVQIAARVLEVALHKAHELGFPLDRIVDGAGSAPLAPPAAEFITAMGRGNDSILFAGQVQLFVACDDTRAAALARQLPSSASADYGRPFAEIFKAVHYDFYRIDPLLFSPAQVMISSVETGNSFSAGRLDEDLLERSFGAASV